MAINLNEAELKSLTRAGAVIEDKHVLPKLLKSVTDAIRALTQQLAHDKSLPAPQVTVTPQAPQVIVKPEITSGPVEITLQNPKRWKFTIKRTEMGEIESITAVAE